MNTDTTIDYRTDGGIVVSRTQTQVELSGAIDSIIDQLDSHKGALFTSTFEFPGRYTRWDMGFVDPALQLNAKDRLVELRALNGNGCVLLACVNQQLQNQPQLFDSLEMAQTSTHVRVVESHQQFDEAERSKQPSVFSVLREIISALKSDQDEHLGLYGAFGYDLAFQFERVEKHLERDPSQRDLALFIPDRLTIVDHQRQSATRFAYEFAYADFTSHTSQFGLDAAIVNDVVPFQLRAPASRQCDHAPGEYARTVELAKERFKCGDLFEVVPAQTFSQPATAPPSELFRRLRECNPAPFGAFMNLGDNEYLVAASPEMYVRVTGSRVETCPIAGTIERGSDIITDADQILSLLNSRKDESELTMCTDVDRNDKSRICVPGSVKVIGRRQIEMYSRLIHTVDHVEGTLLPGCDAIDAFLSHAWAVTITGAPKLWSMRFIEQHEKSPRVWYGGAIGAFTFNGNANTGLTLRTMWIKDGMTHVRAGATLLMDSDPPAEERETRIKASALLDAIESEIKPSIRTAHEFQRFPNVRALLADHEDSFVHTLAGYFRALGVNVQTVRVELGGHLDETLVQNDPPDLMILSPGPGKPSDFNLSHSVQTALDNNIALFGVCLGLQGITEHFGGTLATLDYPAHGKASIVSTVPGKLFDGLPRQLSVGRYHSLYAERSKLPAPLAVTAETEDGIVMAVEHETLPVAAVQFHPESMMSMKGDAGLQMIQNVIRNLVRANSHA